MIPYDQTYLPPAPLVEIGVGPVTGRRRRQTVRALIDTGSDITAIPRGLVDVLRLYPISRLELEDVASQRTMVLSYAVQITVGGLLIPRVEVIVTGLDYAILGRDVLSNFYVVLNGPELTFDLSTSPLSPRD